LTLRVGGLGIGLRVEGLELRVKGLGFRDKGLGLQLRVNI